MKIKVKVHPNSSKEDIRAPRTPTDPLEVWLKEKPLDGKANVKLVKMLKRYFGKPIELKSGFTSRIKVVEVG